MSLCGFHYGKQSGKSHKLRLVRNICTWSTSNLLHGTLVQMLRCSMVFLCVLQWYLLTEGCLCWLLYCFLYILLAMFFFVKGDKVITSWVTFCSVTRMSLICEALGRDIKHHEKQNLHVHSLVVIFFNNCLVKWDGSVQLFLTACGPTECTLIIFPVFRREMNAWGEDSTLNPMDDVLGH